MNIEQLEHNTKIIEQANTIAKQLIEISKVVLLYNNGAPANSCMERIKKIIMEKTNGR